jgi:hypothetical protein
MQDFRENKYAVKRSIGGRVHGIKGITASLRSAVIPFGVPCISKLLPYSFHLYSLFVFVSFLDCVWKVTKTKILHPPAGGRRSNLSLRREGDSNPRYSFPYGSLANCWFKPLTHLSKNVKKELPQFIRQPADGLSHSPISPKMSKKNYGSLSASRRMV